MTASLLCETVTGRTTAELVAARDAASGADMVELRLDGMADPDVERALHARRLPAIVTCRPVWEGGRFEGSEDGRRALLVRALEAGAEYVDLEWQARFDDLIRTYPGRVVVSSHDFGGVPEDLCARVRTMRGTGAAIVKIAVTARRLSDALPLLEIAKAGDAVVVGMGDAGLPTRLLATRFGSRWTYAGDGVAPGQVPSAVMIDRYRFKAVGPASLLYGVVGDNVMHSLSPAMHNAAFASAGLDAVYVPLQAADFEDFRAFADVMGVAGASVTIPFKVDALEAADAADELTRRVGAANTLRRRDGAWDATNTDVAGFLEPLDAVLGEAGAGSAAPHSDGRRDPAYVGRGGRAERVREGDEDVRRAGSAERPRRSSLRGARVTVLGAGGAARAAVVGLASRGAGVTVCARNGERARAMASSLGVESGPWPPVPGSWDILVNATPLGSASAPEASPLPGGPFTGGLVYDLTYGPRESPLLAASRQAGCRTIDGLPMLVAQAERQFEWWTGRRPLPGIMRAAALAAVGPPVTDARDR